MNLSSNCKIILAKAAQGAATTAVTTDVIDMAGYREIIFVGTITTKAANNNVCLQEDSASTGATLADLAGTGIANQTYFKIGLVRPKKRYVAAKVTRGTSSATGEIWAILFKGRTGPITSAVSALTEETHVSPDAGTA
ncbi:MAG: hypothetical protein EOM14_10150 [Clostridia bacterium]|nr:hypothetical protein [Clostridia bacterium]